MQELISPTILKAPVSGVPQPTGAPTIAGTIAVGQTLTVTDEGTYDPPETSYEYQWQRKA